MFRYNVMSSIAYFISYSIFHLHFNLKSFRNTLVILYSGLSIVVYLGKVLYKCTFIIIIIVRYVEQNISLRVALSIFFHKVSYDKCSTPWDASVTMDQSTTCSNNQVALKLFKSYTTCISKSWYAITAKS